MSFVYDFCLARDVALQAQTIVYYQCPQLIVLAETHNCSPWLLFIVSVSIADDCVGRDSGL